MDINLQEILKNDNLQNNYNRIIGEMQSCRGSDFVEPSDKLKNILSKICATHTFPLNDSRHEELYKKILFQDRALLSRQKQEIPSHRSLGAGEILKDYVFAYLGIHDHHYAKDPTLITCIPAFGVFIPSHIENKHMYNNATRRDLSSPEASYDKSKEFLSIALARNYVAYQIVNKHDENFWCYWGKHDKIISDKKYSDEHWKQKIEIHYWKRINCCEFAALLWPILQIKSSDGTEFDDPDMIKEISEFKKDNPNVRVYPYACNYRHFWPQFYYASFLITNFYYTNLDYISVEDFTIEFEKRQN